MTRTFTDQPAVRGAMPLLIGLMGPSGSGKTFSALRLATGIQSVTGGDIYAVDTESSRMKHYADLFAFRHLPFAAPFSSIDYLSALQHCVKQGAKIVIIDSMSHEHEGPGGVLDQHEKELDRIAGQDYAKRERSNFLAWAKPKAQRRELINGLMQMNCNFIFCFRAKEKIKIVKVDGKNTPQNQGWMPIAGEEFIYEQTVCALLLPGSQGRPSWQSDQPGERAMMKLPVQFRGIIDKPDLQLSEDVGRQLAEWSGGKASAPPVDHAETARAAARQGEGAFTAWWRGASQEQRRAATGIADELTKLREAAGGSPPPAGGEAGATIESAAPAEPDTTIADTPEQATLRGEADHARGLSIKAVPAEWRDDADLGALIDAWRAGWKLAESKRVEAL